MRIQIESTAVSQYLFTVLPAVVAVKIGRCVKDIYLVYWVRLGKRRNRTVTETHI
jgi:hypothetical protein